MVLFVGAPSQSRIRSTAPPRGELFVPPQSLRDSSPKGTPFGAAVKFPATTEAVPLGKVAANAVSRRKGYHGKQFCLREFPKTHEKNTLKLHKMCIYLKIFA